MCEMRAKPRCAICGISHETNTFSTLRTELSDFRVQRGDEILQDPFWGTIPDVEWAPCLLGSASPHALVSREAYVTLRDELVARLSAAAPVDGVFMNLHGAMEIENIGDGESDLLEHVREVVGPDVPIVARLDLHGNIAPAVVERANVLTALRTAPHVDGVQTRDRAVSHLPRCLKENLRPVTVMVKLPLLLPGEYAVTSVEPAKSLYARLADIESEPGIMDASIMIGCAWTDSPFTSVGTLVVAEEDGARASRLAAALGEEIWERRHEFGPDVPTMPVEDAIAEAVAGSEYPVFISDSGDNVTAGGAGDLPIVFEKLVEADTTAALVAGLTDPEAVAECARRGVGAEVTLSLGGKLDQVNGRPVSVTGKVEHVASPCLAVFRVKGVTVILASDRRAFSRLESLSQAGLAPPDYRIIVVKQGYLAPELRQMAKKAIMALTPGFTDLRLERLPFRRLTRPIFPLDPNW